MPSHTQVLELAHGLLRAWPRAGTFWFMAGTSNWGKLGNKLRKKKLSKARRAEIARIAAMTRWHGKPPQENPPQENPPRK